MNRNFQLVLGVLALGIVCVVQSATAESGPTAHALPKRPSAAARQKHGVKTESVPAASKEELEQFKQMIADQHRQEQERLDALQQVNRELGMQLKGTQDKLSFAEERINRLTTEESPKILNLQAEVAAVKLTEVSTASYIERQKQLQPDRDHPLALHYKGVSITPGGFFAAEGLYRGHAENADINTSWVSIPFDSQTMSRIGEFRATSRQTRLSLLSDSVIGNARVTGYFETDFLGTGYGATEVQSNGYSNRIRQMWGRVQFPSGWTFVGGQMWSLITTNRNGIENLTEFGTPLIDGSQFLGNDYARQTAFRVTKMFDSNRITAAFAVENAATVGVVPGNVPTSVSSLISGLSTTGTGALSNTTYSTNTAPDLIAKVAFDPGFGHYEVKAIGRTFRDRLDSTPAVAATKTTAAVPATPGSNNTELGGAIGGAAYLPLYTKRVNYIVEGMWGDIGRYGATATDVVVKPNGQLSPEKSIHGLTGIESHPTARLDWYGFASDEYLPRNYGYGLKSIDNTKCFLETGYSCSASIKSLAGATTGIWYRFYKGPAGTVQYGANYAYVTKNTWSGVNGAPRGIENILESSFRYYLP